MDRLLERAARWGIETEHYDGLGRHWQVEPAVITRILDALAGDKGHRAGIGSDETARAVDQHAFQGVDTLGQRFWAIAVQLYSIRSDRNWGHGDFTDLSQLVDIASALGASGIGLNPLHALFDGRADEASPYYPSSRSFLNPLYIDINAIPEFSESSKQAFSLVAENLRSQEFVDYARVADAKSKALAIAHESFRRHAGDDRRAAFERFRNERGQPLAAYAVFEVLRCNDRRPWSEWPVAWRHPDPETVRNLRSRYQEQAEYFEYVQWLAHQQLAVCRQKAREAGLSLGLYLDIAVGVRPDGFDAWYDQELVCTELEIGAPPDQLNRDGQRWGLAGVNPVKLAANNCVAFRRLLRSSMECAGAVRLDHILGLKRLYLVPKGMKANQGAYVKFPFDVLLSATAEESAARKCIVIGEDLGTVPPGFQDALASKGIWSYQVMLFQRAADGGFIAPELYRADALVTFATHDLPTFAGWVAGRDRVAKRTLGLDPGEGDHDRAAALDALGRAMAWRGLVSVDYLSVVRFLADTPSRLMVITLEDALGQVEQVNLPGTVAEYPNWRRRVSVPLDKLLAQSSLAAIARTMTAVGRGRARSASD